MVEWGAVWWVVIGRVCAHGVGRATISERRYIQKLNFDGLTKRKHAPMYTYNGYNR